MAHPITIIITITDIKLGNSGPSGNVSCLSKTEELVSCDDKLLVLGIPQLILSSAALG